VDRLGREAAAFDQPGDKRVGVPHLARSEFVATPNRRRDVGDQVEHSLRQIWIIRESLWTFDSFVDIRDDSATPAAHLVTEDPKTSRPAATDRALPDDATLGPLAIPDRSLLDDEAALRKTHLERRVVEVAGRPPREPCRHRLEDTPVQTHRVAARAERKPVEVDPRFGPCSHRGKR
jgi:hypothetical protein